jgi:hypothetical protein
MILLLKLAQTAFQIFNPGTVFGHPALAEVARIQVLPDRLVSKPAHRIQLDYILINGATNIAPRRATRHTSLSAAIRKENPRTRVATKSG